MGISRGEAEEGKGQMSKGRVAEFFQIMNDACEPGDLVALADLIGKMSESEQRRVAQRLLEDREKLLELKRIKKSLAAGKMP
jgi:hypothetical protein